MKKQKRKIIPLLPEERHLPVYKYSVGQIKDGVMEGDMLFEYIVLQYKRKSNREHFDATLPLDYLEKVREQYYHGNNFIPVPWSNKHSRVPNQEYQDYIKSPEWLSLRKRILSTRNYCEVCGAKDCELHLHHKTYENFKHEKDEDLQVLCFDCHSKIHGRKVGFCRKREVVL